MKVVRFMQSAGHMKSSLWLVNLGFIPRSVDLALLFLRLSAGLSMILLHGWKKLITFPTAVKDFQAVVGPPWMSLGLAVFAEVICSVMLIAGVLTRFAAAVLAITMAVALLVVHKGDMTFEGGGELAGMYLFIYITLLLTGGGRFSADGAGGPYTLAAFGAVAGVLVGYPVSYYFQADAVKALYSGSEYIQRIRAVIGDDAAKGTAIGVTVAMLLVLAIAGFFVGRAMNGRRARVAAVPVTAEQP